MTSFLKETLNAVNNIFAHCRIIASYDGSKMNVSECKTAFVIPHFSQPASLQTLSYLASPAEKTLFQIP